MPRYSAAAAKLLSTLLVANLAALSVRCSGGGGGATPPEDALIQLSNSILSFIGVEGGASPAPQTIQITNSRGASLEGLTSTVSYSTGQRTGWLTAVLSSAAAPSTLTVTVTPGTLTEGSYTASVAIAAAEADNSPQVVTVTFDVGPPAAGGAIIALSSTSQTFTAPQGGANPAAQIVSVTNGGEGTLDGLAAIVTYTADQSTGWLTATLSATTAPSTLTLTAATGGLSAGTYSASVAVTSASASNSPQTINVTFTVVPVTVGPLIALSSTSKTFSATQGGANPAPQTLDVTNGGGGTLSGLTANVSYTAGQPGGWLNATLSATTAPSTLTLTATTGTLPAGSYTATVAVTAPSAGNSPQNVNVTFTVGSPVAAPEIALSASALTFEATAGEGPPEAQTVEVTNSGTGTLSGLETSVTYAAGQPTGWVSASLDRSTAPSTLTIGVTIGALTPGTYTASIAVASAVASNSPQAVIITLNVAAVPSGAIAGTTRNALDASAVPFATVELRAGADDTTGIPLQTTSSGSDGGYRFDQLPAGTYTALARAGGYVNGQASDIAVSANQVSNRDIILSPILGEGETRIVLTWSNRLDLDAHLTGPVPDGERFHVYWGARGSLTSEPFAYLEIDDRNGNGPETISIGQQRPGVYRFSVHDYTNRNSPLVAELGQSGATVQVLQGNRLIARFNVPEDDGTLWTVFELDGLTLTPINTITYASGVTNARATGISQATDASSIPATTGTK